MAAIADIVRFLDDLLEPDSFDDYGPNGLQVPGAEQVTRALSGVSAQLALFERAAASGAQLVLVHHGLFWERQPRVLSRAAARRLATLLAAEVNLVAYHLPLDAHPEVGNNALIAQGLGCATREPFALHGRRSIGVVGGFADDGIAAPELFERVERLTGRAPLVFDSGPERVRRLGIVSGGGANDLTHAIAAGLDAFLTGEPSEPAMAEAREAGVHFIAAGHYATETFGVRRLGELLAERFDVEHEFVDLPNPV